MIRPRPRHAGVNHDLHHRAEIAGNRLRRLAPAEIEECASCATPGVATVAFGCVMTLTSASIAACVC
jgi:hypothetical protein